MFERSSAFAKGWVVVAAKTMLKRSLFVMALLLVHCGGSDDSSGGASGSSGSAGSAGSSGSAGTAGTGGSAGSGGTAGVPTSFQCPAGFSFVAGKNDKVPLGDYDRTFYVDFPTNTSKAPAVVFQWHGFGDTADNFRTALGLEPDADPDFPFIRVTPDDTAMIPPDGLDWSMFAQDSADVVNPDLQIFSAIAGCLIEQNGADPDRIYSVGFSAGAIQTNFVHSKFAADVAATVAYSGAFFNDKVETDAVHPLNYKITYDWPALDPAIPGTALITHGGPNDVYTISGVKVIDFEASAQAALPFLAAANWTVIDCTHNNGHQPAPDVGPSVVLSFLKSHVRGQASPWKGGALPDGMPSSCTLH